MTSADDTTAAPESSGDVFAELDTPAADVAAEPSATSESAAQIEPQTKPTTEAQPQSQPSSDAIPAWRLREEAERRRAIEAEAAEMRRRIADFERQQEAAKPPPSVFEDEQGFAQHHVQRGLEPIQNKIGQFEQQFGQMREQFSQMMAMQRFGSETVQKAYQEMQQAMGSHDPEAAMVYQRMMNGSMDPYGDMVTWYKRRSVVSEVGGDLTAFRKKVSDEALESALKDPAFLQKAVEAARSSARPVTRAPQTANVTALPSLNRATAAAEGDEPEDVGDVLDQAFGGR